MPEWINAIDSTIDKAFELTQLPQLTGAGAGYVGRGFDALTGTHIAPIVERIGHDIPRMTAETLLTIPETASIAGAPVAAATWLNRLRKLGQIAGYASAATRGYAETDSPLGALISAGTLGVGNKLFMPLERGGLDVGLRGSQLAERVAGYAPREIAAEEGSNLLSPNLLAQGTESALNPRTYLQQVMGMGGRAAADVGTGIGLSETARQAEMSVGPNAVGLNDERRNPFTAENVAGNVLNALPMGVGALLAARTRFEPKQVEQLHSWIENRKAAEQAQLGYDWEGPVTATQYHDTFGTLEGGPGFRGQDLIPTEDYWSPENFGLEDVSKEVKPDASSNIPRLALGLRARLEVLKEHEARGEVPEAEQTRQGIKSLLDGISDVSSPQSRAAIDQTLKEFDATARQMPPEDAKGFVKFVQDANDLIDHLNENTVSFDTVQKSEKTKGQTWHPNARSSVVVGQLQDRGLLSKVTPEWLKENFNAEFDQTGDPQFAYQVVLQKVANRLLDEVPSALDKRAQLTPPAESSSSPAVGQIDAFEAKYIDALKQLPPEVSQDILQRSVELRRKPNTFVNGMMVNRETSWRRTIIQAMQSYDPETQTVLLKKGGRFERTSLRTLTLRDEHGNYVYEPPISTVRIGEGGKGSVKVGGKTAPERNIQDLQREGGRNPDEVLDEDLFKQTLAEEGIGGSLSKKAELEGTAGRQSGGEEAVPETGMTLPETLTTPEGKTVSLTEKKDQLLKTLGTLSDDQLYTAAKDAFRRKVLPGRIPPSDPREPIRRKMLRPALMAALEDLKQPQGAPIGPNGKKFLSMLGAMGVGSEKTERLQLRRGLENFFGFQTPVQFEGAKAGLRPDEQRLGYIVNKLLDPKVVEGVKRFGKPLAQQSEYSFKWTTDKGSIPGEPIAFIGDDPETAPGAIIQHDANAQGTRSVWEAVLADGTRIPNTESALPSKYFDNSDKAKLAVERELSKKQNAKNLESEADKTIPSSWKLTIQEPSDGAPGYSQVDMIDDKGVNAGSTSLEDLQKQGYSVPDTSQLKTGQYRFGHLKTETGDILTNTQPPGSFTADVYRTFRSRFSQILGDRGYSGSLRDLYTEMAVAVAQTTPEKLSDFYRVSGKEWGLANAVEGRAKVGVNLDENVAQGAEVKYANRILATLAHEISHIDTFISQGFIDAPDAFSERRRVHRDNLVAMVQTLSPDEREAMLQTLKDGLVPEEFQTKVRDKTTGRIYGADDPDEFVAVVNELLAASLLRGKKTGVKTALETLDYGPIEVREYAVGTYRALHDVLMGMKESIADTFPRVQANKSTLPTTIDRFVTSEMFESVVRSAKEASMLRDSDRALAQARSFVASMSPGAASAPPLVSPAMWLRTAKDLEEGFRQTGITPETRLMPNAEEGVKTAQEFLSKRAYDKNMRPGVWARWFYPFSQLMFSMERSGFDLARPVANLALGVESSISRLRSGLLEPFIVRGVDGKVHFDQENTLVKKVSEEKSGPWRDALNRVSAWQQENGAQSMFVLDSKSGQVMVNDQVKGAQEKWEKIRTNLKPEDQQVVMSGSVSLDRTGQNGANLIVAALNESNSHRVARLFMAMNRKMTYDQALDLGQKTLVAYQKGDAQSLQAINPQQRTALDSLLTGDDGLLTKFNEVSQKLLSRPGFRPESLPGDWVLRYETPEGETRYLSADSEHKANWLMRKLKGEGMTQAGEIVKKSDLKNFTEFDDPDALLRKFSEVEQAKWSKLVDNMETTFGPEVAAELKSYVPGAVAMKELSVKGLNQYLVERKNAVDRERFDYLDGTMSWAGRLAASVAFRSTRGLKDLILADPRARMFPSFEKMTNEHFDEMMQPKSQWSKELRTFSSAYMMGGSLASGVINGTQSVVSLVPILIQLAKDKSGPVGAYKSLGRAIADASSVTFDKKWQSLAREAESIPAEKWSLEHAKASLYRRNVEDGGVNHGIILDNIFSSTDQKTLMAAKFGHGNYGPTTVDEMVRNPVYLAAQLSLKPFGWVEQFNNKVSLMAGVDQGWRQGLRGEALYDHAKLVKTLSTYGGGKANVPGLVPKLSTPYTRSAVGLVNNLQQYGYGIVATYAQLMKDSLGKSAGLSPLERRQAQKAFGTMVATQVALGGALGLPFAAAGLIALEKVFGVPANQLVRQGLASLGTDDDQGSVIAETALNGIGNQMFGLDVSSRLGVSNLLGTSSYRGFNLQDMAGPTVSVIGNALQGLNLFAQGEPMKAAKALVPNAFKSVVELTDTKSKYGDLGLRDQGDNLLYTPTPTQAAMYLAGFRPREFSQKRQAQTMLTLANQRATQQRSRQLDQYGEQLLSGDPSGAVTYAQGLRYQDPTLNPQDVLRSIVSRAVDSTTTKDLLASGGQASEQERQGIARTFGSDVITRQSEVQRAALAAQLGSQVGLPIDPKTFSRAALVDSLVQSKGMPRSQAMRLAEFLQ